MSASESMNNLETISESIRAALEAKHAAREKILNESRGVVRLCANTIRATHRREWAEAEKMLTAARMALESMLETARPHPDLYHAGYTQDSAKEFVEAAITLALIRDQALPTLESLHAEPSTYLNGLCEAASELRRYVLDLLRADEYDQAGRLLDKIDQVYDTLVTFDYPDAVSGGLRHRADSLRGVLERTRGDFTMSLRQKRLQDTLARAEKRIEG